MGMQSILTFLVNAGFSKAGAAALGGNIYAESTGNSKAFQKGLSNLSDDVLVQQVDSGQIDLVSFLTQGTNGKWGFGICQWTYKTRVQNLVSFWKQSGSSIGDETMQCRFLLHELQTSFASLYGYLKTTTDMRAATVRVLFEFENPSDKSDAVQATRYRFAQNLYNQYLSGNVSSASSAAVTETVAATYTTVLTPMPLLKQGDKGLAVGMAQWCLVKKGYNLGTTGPNRDGIDNDFGPTMAAAVRVINGKYGITPAEQITANTWVKLYA